MTDEQIEEIKSAISNVRKRADEVEQMLADYARCESETSKKYLGAAILKIAVGLGSTPQRTA